MTALSKATLQEISADSSATPVPDTELEVQFNPQSLKLTLSSQSEGGDTKARQNRQYLGKSSTTLAFDLHFDTADQGTPDAPVSVRTQTAMVDRFVLPKGKGNTKQQPPKCRFHWGELVLDGIIESLSIDFDLFASDGTPLRAKMGVSLKEQDAKYELLESGPGANQAHDVASPGAPNTGGFTDSSAQALAGESAADFAVRVGLDPGAWRGIAAQLSGGSSLSLQAGFSIGFSTSLSASVGIGVSVGIELGANVSLDASFGLAAGAGTASGFALSAAGGLGSALATVASVKADAAATQARRAFASAVPASAAKAVAADIPPASTTPRPTLPAQTRSPLKTAAAFSTASLPRPGGNAPSAPPPPVADPRATSFGQGVPLRPRSAETVAMAQGGRIALRPTARAAASDPFAPPWASLPGLGGATNTNLGVTAQRPSPSRAPKRPCGCK